MMIVRISCCTHCLILSIRNVLRHIKMVVLLRYYVHNAKARMPLLTVHAKRVTYWKVELLQISCLQISISLFCRLLSYDAA